MGITFKEINITTISVSGHTLVKKHKRVLNYILQSSFEKFQTHPTKESYLHISSKNHITNHT